MSKQFKSIEYANQYLDIAAKLNLNLAFCGAHGRAKTSVIKQYAEKNNYHLETVILSRMTPEDMIGLPTIKKQDGKTVTTFSAPDWLAKASDGETKVLIFFDEFNNADIDVQASILDLIESREANGCVLNKNAQIVMAFNPMSIAPNAKKLSKATRDRLCVIPLCDSSSDEDYLKYYENIGKSELTFVLNSFEQTLVNNYDDEIIKDAYDNAEFTYRSLEKAYDIAAYCVKNKLDEHIAEEMICGYAGEIGTPFTKQLFQVLNKESFVDLPKIYKKTGVDGVITYLQGDKLGTTFAEIAANMNNVRSIVTPPDFEKVLQSLTTKEFRMKYDQL